MKRLLFFIACAVVCVPSIADAATLSRPVNGLGLVGYWSFNEGTSTIAGDFSGYGNGGAVTEAVWTQGKRGASLDFDGTDDYVEIPHNTNQWLVDGGTFSAWIKPRSLGESAGRILDKSTGGSAEGGYQFYMSTGGNNISFRINGGTVRSAAASSVTYNVWSHVAVTFASDGTVTMYVNGVQSGTPGTTNAPSGITNTAAPRVGNRSSVTDRTFNGAIDEVRIYNRVLTAAEIAASYTAGAAKINTSRTAVNSGLVAWWTMDGTDMAFNIGDKSGNGNNAFLVNMATSTAQIPGKIGSALLFDGGDDYAFANDSNSLDTANGLTVSAWVYDSNDGTQNHTLNKDDVSSNRNWIIRRQSDTVGNYHVWNSGGTLRQFTPANSWKINEWFHITYTVSVSGSTINLEVFINGVSVGTDSFSGTAIQTGTSPVHISKNTVAGTSEKAQRLDDVRIYNRALTAAEAKQIYNEGAGTKVNTSTSTGSLAEGLLSHWAFNGPNPGADLSGRGNNGFFSGAATSTVLTIGKLGQAFTFNGSTHYFQTTNTNSVRNLSQASISLWFKPEVLSGATQILYEEAITASTNSRFSIRIHTTNQLRFFGRAPDGAGGTTWVDSNVALTVGEWYHVVAIFNADTDVQTLVVNGVVQTASVAGTAFTDSDPINPPRIGSRPGSSYFRGVIDDVRLYNRALTTDEAKRLYNMGR